MAGCNNSTDGVYDTLSLVILSSSNGVTVFVCFVAILVTVFLGLFRQTVYRLALYQVLAAIEVGMVLIAQIHLLNDPDGSFCIAMAFLFTQAMWAKLILTIWVTFHLVAFAVFHKNFKKLEIFYLITTLLFSCLVASLPFTTQSYGLSGSWCWIEDTEDNCEKGTKDTRGIIEQFALWFGPSTAILLTTVLAMIVMLVVLAKRSRPRSEKNTTITVTGHYQNRKALKQLLPLAAYPILFCLFNMFPLADYLYDALHTSANESILESVSAVCNAGLGFSTGMALILHIIMSKFLARNRKYVSESGNYGYGAIQHA